MNAALANFQKAADLEPQNLGTTVEVARCLIELAKYQGAIEKCEHALQEKPMYSGAHAYRALALSKVDRIQEAVEELQRARRIGVHVNGKISYTNSTTPHLTSITNSIGTAEAYTFSTTANTPQDPFSAANFGSNFLLSSILWPVKRKSCRVGELSDPGWPGKN